MMPIYENLRAEPYVSISTDSANEILQQFELAMKSIGLRMEDSFYNSRFASNCEHQAWLLWLKANLSYHGATYHLNRFNIQDRQRRNIERNRSLMDSHLYLKLRDKANSAKYTGATFYAKHSDKMKASIDQCCEFVVVAHAIRRGVRRFESSANYDLSEFALVQYRMDDERIGVCIGDMRQDRESGSA